VELFPDLFYVEGVLADHEPLAQLLDQLNQGVLAPGGEVALAPPLDPFVGHQLKEYPVEPSTMRGRIPYDVGLYVSNSHVFAHLIDH